jgi:hypothetical protein
MGLVRRVTLNGAWCYYIDNPFMRVNVPGTDRFALRHFIPHLNWACVARCGVFGGRHNGQLTRRAVTRQCHHDRG